MLLATPNLGKILTGQQAVGGHLTSLYYRNFVDYELQFCAEDMILAARIRLAT
jgi:hypothetical protein